MVGVAVAMIGFRITGWLQLMQPIKLTTRFWQMGNTSPFYSQTVRSMLRGALCNELGNIGEHVESFKSALGLTFLIGRVDSQKC